MLKHTDVESQQSFHLCGKGQKLCTDGVTYFAWGSEIVTATASASSWQFCSDRMTVQLGPLAACHVFSNLCCVASF